MYNGRGQYYPPTAYPAIMVPPPSQQTPEATFPGRAYGPGEPDQWHEESVRKRYTCVGATEETIRTWTSTHRTKLRFKKIAVILSAAGTVRLHVGQRTPVVIDNNGDHASLDEESATPMDIIIPEGVTATLTAEMAGTNTVDYYVKWETTAILQ